MAGADYLKCEVCGARIMYEPDRDPGIKVVCVGCYAGMGYELKLYKAALTKSVSLPMGQLPHESGRYYAWMNNGQVVVMPDRYGKGK